MMYDVAICEYDAVLGKIPDKIPASSRRVSGKGLWEGSLGRVSGKGLWEGHSLGVELGTHLVTCPPLGDNNELTGTSPSGKR